LKLKVLNKFEIRLKNKQLQMENHKHFLELATKIAVESVLESNGGPFGAIIVKDGNIIGKGYNKVTFSNDPTAHAEIVAIRDACNHLNSYQLKDCIIYSSCEPCPMCMGAIYWARPKMLVFGATRNDAAKVGFDDSYIYEEISKPHSRRSIKTIQIKTSNHLEPFKEWTKKENKLIY